MRATKKLPQGFVEMVFPVDPAQAFLDDLKAK
jgi:hypothetical protein